MRPRNVDRRTYLRALGAGMVSVAGCQSPTGRVGAGRTGTQNFEFDRVVDAVEDAGCDPTGEEPCEEEIRDAIADGTRIDFPEGTYRITERIEVREVDRIGFSGTSGATFLVEEGYNDLLLLLSDIEEVLFENFDIDIQAPDATTGLEPRASQRLRIENVRFLGRGSHPDTDVTNALMPACTSPDAVGVVRNVVAKRGSMWSTYKNGTGRVGIWIGFLNEGTITVENVDLREFGNNAIYASRTPGNVHVEGGYFLNNNSTSVRISGEGSYVDGATIEIDPEKYTGPEPNASQSYFDGVRVEQGELGPDYKPPGVDIRNCDVSFRSVKTNAIPIAIWETGRTATIRNTTIELDDNEHAVWRFPDRIQSDRHRPPDGPRWVRMNNVTITGDASTSSAVRLVDAPNSLVHNCRIDQTGRDRNGVMLVRSGNSRIDGGSITAWEYPVGLELPEDGSSSACLVRFTGGPTLRSVNDQPSTNLGAYHGTPVTIPENEDGCITPGRIPQTELDDSRWLMLTAVDETTASGYLFDDE